MAKFDPPQGPSFDLDRLVTTLNFSKLQTTNPPLYQVVFQLLRAVQAFQRSATANINSSSTVITNLADRTYLTVDNEVANLPNSRRELAGDNIIFDDSVPNERTISGLSWSVLTNGDPDFPELVFVNGDVIMVHIP